MSFLEPGYAQICPKDHHANTKDCPSYNVIAYGFWRLVGFFNDHEPAFTALATIVIGIFTWTLWRSTNRAGEHFRVTERAYFQLSHKGGVTFPAGEKVALTMQVKNWGRTPGTVTDQRVGPMLIMEKDGKLSGPVDYSGLEKSTSPYTFLVPTGHYNWDIGFEFTEAGVVQAILAGEITLFMVGYVDYRDQFGDRWRSGYARRYATIAGQNPLANNLSYVTAKGFNDDRHRLPGEGVDWDD